MTFMIRIMTISRRMLHQLLMYQLAIAVTTRLPVLPAQVTLEAALWQTEVCKASELIGNK